MLKVENLVKDFKTGFIRKSVRVLHDVTFSVDSGEIYGFIGHNGAGKTTTFKLLLGFASITSGRIEIMGRPVTDVAMRSRVGYLPEEPYFYDYLTGEELLRYMGELHGIERKVLRVRVDELLERVKMTYARGLQLRKYSKGMLQRIGIAQSLIGDPDLLIFDEPMSGLDPIGQKEIRELMVELKERGKTVLLSSHILANVEALCDRVGVIVKGTVVKEGSLTELLQGVDTGYELFLGNRASVAGDFTDIGVEHESRAGMVVLKFPEALKERVLRRVHEKGLDIVALQPHRKSLEGLFMEETAKS